MTTIVTGMAQRETLFNSPDKVRSQFLEADGYRTQYFEAGESASPPLVLVHGGSSEIGMGADRWYPNIIPLSRHFYVHAVDELGHGYTDPPRDLNELGNVQVRAEHVIAFIEALGRGPVHLVGQSQGGWIAGYAAIKRPDLIRRLILIDSATLSGSALTPGGLPYFQNIFEPGTMIPKFDLGTEEGIRRTIGEFMYDTSVITPEWMAYLLELSRRWNARYMEHAREFWREGAPEKRRKMYSIGGKHISELVETIQAPTLVMWGKQSVKGLEPGVELYKRIPGAQMHIFDRADHFLWLDHPDDFNDLVTWFLSKA